MGFGRAGHGSLAAAGAEQFTQSGLILFGRLGGVEEALNNVGEMARVVVKRAMASSFKDLQ